MNSRQFFSANAEKIARDCTITIDGLTITIAGVWTRNRAVYQCRDAAELRAIARIVQDAGTVVYHGGE